jgi:phage terminase small subunit
MEASGAFDRDPARRRKDPETTGALGRAPKHLDVGHRKVWAELQKVLPIGVARNADKFSFELIVGLMHKQRYSIITGSELATLCSLLSKFGLDPQSRAKVAMPVSTKADATNPFASFL